MSRADATFTSRWARLVLMGALAVPVGFGVFGLVMFVVSGGTPLVAIAVGVAASVAGVLLWNHHGRITFGEDAVVQWNYGLRLRTPYDRIDGYVWRPPPNTFPKGDGIVFVHLDPAVPGGLRGLSPVATASYLLAPDDEAALETLIAEHIPGCRRFKTPSIWLRPRSTMVRLRDGGEDVPT